MDKELARLVDLHTPKINPAIGNGLAVEHMRHTEMYLDQVFRAAAKGFPAGLEYVRYERCTPEEEFEENTKVKTNKRVFDVARSDLYMVKYMFSFNGVMLPPRYLFLPFVSDAGTITLGGSRFNISPILSDRVISIGVDNIFVRLLRDRLTFERMPQHYMEDGVRKTVMVPWSMIYHKNAKMKKLPPTVKNVNCTLAHYLFCKYGFTDAFMKFANCAPVVGGAEINPNTYPPEEWYICQSTQVKPKGVGRGYYQPTGVRIAVRKSEMTPTVRSMIGGFFYVADHFPDRIRPEYVESKRLWMILMGHILFSGSIPEGKLHDDIADHISSLDEYLDALVITKIKDAYGWSVSDVYELFAMIISNFNEWVITAKDKVASMYDKELSILYYVLFDITGAIFKLYFKLKAASKPPKELTAKEITNQMNLTLRTGLIFSITKGHGEISTVSVPGDNKAFKVTSLLVPQGNSSKLSSRKDRAVLSDPAKRLHASIAEVGGYSNLPKSQPDGRARLNPHAQVDYRHVIKRNPARVELLDEVQRKIGRL